MLQRRSSVQPTRGITGSLAIRSRYAKLRQLETRTIALLVGFILGSTTGWILWWVGVDTAVAAAIAGLVWLAATLIIYNRYESMLTRKTGLVIVDTKTTTGGTMTEVLITNRGADTVELRDATIADTAGRRYSIEPDMTLQPGERTTLKLPSTFASSRTDAERKLPLGYTLDRSQTAPVVYSRTGAAFELHGNTAAETTAWTSDDPDQSTQSTVSPRTVQGQE